MIGVVVRDDQMIDARDPGRLHRGLDAADVAPAVAGPARIDKDGLPRRRDDQGRGAALDVDVIDVERRLGRHDAGSHDDAEHGEQDAHVYVLEGGAST